MPVLEYLDPVLPKLVAKDTTLRLGPQTYQLAGTIKLESGARVIGYGRDVTTVRSGIPVPLFSAVPGRQEMAVSDLAMEYANPIAECVCLDVNKAKAFEARQIRVRSAYTFLRGDNADGVILDDVVIDGLVKRFVSIEDRLGPSDNLTCIRCVVSNVGQGHVYRTHGVRHQTILDCRFTLTDTSSFTDFQTLRIENGYGSPEAHIEATIVNTIAAGGSMYFGGVGRPVLSLVLVNSRFTDARAICQSGLISAVDIASQWTRCGWDRTPPVYFARPA